MGSYKLLAQFTFRLFFLQDLSPRLFFFDRSWQGKEDRLISKCWSGERREDFSEWTLLQLITEAAKKKIASKFRIAAL